MMSKLSQKGNRYSFDALVIGSGLASLLYVLELQKHHPNASIAIVTKKKLLDSNSYLAQGGIAAVSFEHDTLASHIQDTLNAGAGLCNIAAVEEILKYGPNAIALLSQYGLQFDPELGQEGGHACRRIYHVNDDTGKAVMTALSKAIIALSTQKNEIKVFEEHTAVNLITQQLPHTPASQNEVIGAYILDEKKNQIHTFLSKVVIIATGGAGKVYRYTSNPDTATGDGIAMAYRAGARVGNLEFYQFHPTLLYHPDLTNFLISEAVRGEGAKLINPTTGKRFMQHYDAERQELATRDIVARAIFNEIEKNETPYVYLDIRHQTQRYLLKRFPMIYKRLKSVGIDMHKDCIPVVPAAHYLCGGVLTDVNGKTDIDRLYAIGETAFTGLHGANRLASNSLLESAVMAKLCAAQSKHWLEKPPLALAAISDWDSKSVIDLRRASQISAHWLGLRGEMMSYAGIIRTEAGLKDLLHLIRSRRQMIEDYYWKSPITRDIVELRNISLVAELVVIAALKRKESRGSHYREDYPKTEARPIESILTGEALKFA